MAFKQTAAPVTSYEPLRIEVEAIVEHESEGRVTLRLEGVARIPDLDWVDVEKHMIERGIPENDVRYLLDSFANETYLHLLGKALAKRSRLA